MYEGTQQESNFLVVIIFKTRFLTITCSDRDMLKLLLAIRCSYRYKLKLLFTITCSDRYMLKLLLAKHCLRYKAPCKDETHYFIEMINKTSLLTLNYTEMYCYEHKFLLSPFSLIDESSNIQGSERQSE